jgi:hypothetical protein
MDGAMGGGARVCEWKTLDGKVPLDNGRGYIYLAKGRQSEFCHSTAVAIPLPAESMCVPSLPFLTVCPSLSPCQSDDHPLIHHVMD